MASTRGIPNLARLLVMMVKAYKLQALITGIMKIVYGSVRRKTVLSLNLHGQTNNAIAYARFNQWIATKHQKHQFLIMIFANAFVTRV